MAKTVYYRQCRLRKDNSFQTSWIPEHFATPGRALKLRDGDGNWEDGWVVQEVSQSRLEEAQLPDSHREIKEHRKATGDAQPKEKR